MQQPRGDGMGVDTLIRPVTRPVRSWRALGKPQRTEMYVRWSLYLMAPMQLFFVLLAIGANPDLDPPVWVLRFVVAAGLADAVVMVVTLRAGLDHYLGRRDLPVAALATGFALALATVWGVALLGPGPDGTTPTGALMAPVALPFWFAPISVAVPPRRAALVAGAMMALAVPPLLVGGMGVGEAVGALTGLSFALVVVAGTCRCSAWLAGVVWELDAARETQSQLAVAQERLRFSRDLHDVLGRNLTTMALKSELAVQLAVRGRPEAADQMTEVQRIAQESQREVRDLVRGYRSADLQVELTGARSVLRSADVACEVDLVAEVGSLPAAAQSVLGWVVREATTNVLRHSEAAHCRIRLRTEDGRALLEIENDGVPAAPATPAGSTGGHGLAGLRERLAAHGGELHLPAAVPGAFTVLAVLPLDTTAPEVPSR
ncbi:sensor histidine kinase [Kitasatospora camelliae]|uniref:Sensor histidine kinase n=1 Tax=Kitasatospora camelliae TaxID=3156397 RepID=A0AAU8JW44_9ACTN